MVTGLRSWRILRLVMGVTLLALGSAVRTTNAGEPLAGFSAQVLPYLEISSTLDGGVVIRAEKIDFSTLQARVQAASGIRLKVSPALAERAVTANIAALDWTSALRSLFRNYSSVEERDKEGQLRRIYIVSEEGAAEDAHASIPRAEANTAEDEKILLESMGLDPEAESELAAYPHRAEQEMLKAMMGVDPVESGAVESAASPEERLIEMMGIQSSKEGPRGPGLQFRRGVPP